PQSLVDLAGPVALAQRPSHLVAGPPAVAHFAAGLLVAVHPAAQLEDWLHAGRASAAPAESVAARRRAAGHFAGCDSDFARAAASLGFAGQKSAVRRCVDSWRAVATVCLIVFAQSLGSAIWRGCAILCLLRRAVSFAGPDWPCRCAGPWSSRGLSGWPLAS